MHDLLVGYIYKHSDIDGAKEGVKYTSLVVWKTEVNTGIKPISFVKWTIPRRLLSCCRETIIAAPAMNPIRVAFERKSMINPSLQTPNPEQNRIKGLCHRS